MKRAAELFAIDEWGWDSRFVEKAWTSRSEPEPAFISVAVSRWHIVVTTRCDVAELTVRGPETTATATPIPAVPSSSGSCSVSGRSCLRCRLRAWSTGR